MSGWLTDYGGRSCALGGCVLGLPDVAHYVPCGRKMANDVCRPRF